MMRGLPAFKSALTSIKGRARLLATVIVEPGKARNRLAPFPAAPDLFFHPPRRIAMSKRDEYIGKMKLQLDELDAQMDKLEARAAQAK